MIIFFFLVSQACPLQFLSILYLLKLKFYLQSQPMYNKCFVNEDCVLVFYQNNFGQGLENVPVDESNSVIVLVFLFIVCEC